MFSSFFRIRLVPPKQSGFRPGQSCTNQFLSIAHEILSAFDGGHKVRGVFLNKSKAFDKLRHEGLLFKLQQNWISRELITLIKYFLSCRKQRVVLKGQHSSCTRCQSGRNSRAHLKGQLLVLYYF